MSSTEATIIDTPNGGSPLAVIAPPGNIAPALFKVIDLATGSEGYLVSAWRKGGARQRLTPAQAEARVRLSRCLTTHSDLAANPRSA